MRLAIYLYTTDSLAVTPQNVNAAIATIDFAGKLSVSRTVGPANWFELNKRLLAGADELSFPPEDIDQAAYTTGHGIAALLREQSVLRVSYVGTKSARLAALSQALHSDVPPDAAGFFESSTWFSFGPSDIVNFIENAEGDEDVELVDVAQFKFAVSCDNFLGRFDIFRQAVPSVPRFAELRRDLEEVAGPLKLHFSY